MLDFLKALFPGIDKDFFAENIDLIVIVVCVIAALGFVFTFNL